MFNFNAKNIVALTLIGRAAGIGTRVSAALDMHRTTAVLSAVCYTACATCSVAELEQHNKLLPAVLPALPESEVKDMGSDNRVLLASIAHLGAVAGVVLAWNGYQTAAPLILTISGLTMCKAQVVASKHDYYAKYTQQQSANTVRRMMGATA